MSAAPAVAEPQKAAPGSRSPRLGARLALQSMEKAMTDLKAESLASLGERRDVVRHLTTGQRSRFSNGKGQKPCSHFCLRWLKLFKARLQTIRAPSRQQP